MNRMEKLRENIDTLYKWVWILLVQASMPLKFWWEVFQTSIYYINCLPTPILKFCLHQKNFKKRNQITFFLKTFGCSCFPYLRPFRSTKFQFQTTNCVFLSYDNSHKGYLCLHPSGRVYIFCYVVFNENEFPYAEGFLITKKLSPSTQLSFTFQFLDILENDPS